MDAVKGLTPEQITAIMTAPVLSVIGLILIAFFALIVYICIFKLPGWLKDHRLEAAERIKLEREFMRQISELNNKAIIDLETRIHGHYEQIINLLKDQFVDKIDDIRNDQQRVENAVMRVETGQHALVSGPVKKIGTILILILSSTFCIACSSILTRQQRITNIARAALIACKGDKNVCNQLNDCVQLASKKSTYLKDLNDKLAEGEGAFTADLSAYMAEHEVTKLCMEKGIICHVESNRDSNSNSGASYRCNFQKEKDGASSGR